MLCYSQSGHTGRNGTPGRGLTSTLRVRSAALDLLSFGSKNGVDGQCRTGYWCVETLHDPRSRNSAPGGPSSHNYQAESKGIAFGGDFLPQAVHLSYECAFMQCGCAPIISDFGRALMTYPKKDKA